MADPKPPPSAAAVRAARAAQKAKDAALNAQRIADRREAESLKQQRSDAKRERSKLPWGRDWKAKDKEQRELGAKERRLRKKNYD